MIHTLCQRTWIVNEVLGYPQQKQQQQQRQQQRQQNILYERQTHQEGIPLAAVNLPIHTIVHNMGARKTIIVNKLGSENIAKTCVEYVVESYPGEELLCEVQPYREENTWVVLLQITSTVRGIGAREIITVDKHGSKITVKICVDYAAAVPFDPLSQSVSPVLQIQNVVLQTVHLQIHNIAINTDGRKTFIVNKYGSKPAVKTSAEHVVAAFVLHGGP